MCIFIKSMACHEAGKTPIHRRRSHWNRWVCVTLAAYFDTSHTNHNIYNNATALPRQHCRVLLTRLRTHAASLYCFSSQTISLSILSHILGICEADAASRVKTGRHPLESNHSSGPQNTGRDATKSHCTVFSSFMDNKIGSIKELWNKKSVYVKVRCGHEKSLLAANRKECKWASMHTGTTCQRTRAQEHYVLCIS